MNTKLIAIVCGVALVLGIGSGTLWWFAAGASHGAGSNGGQNAGAGNHDQGVGDVFIGDEINGFLLDDDSIVALFGGGSLQAGVSEISMDFRPCYNSNCPRTQGVECAALAFDLAEDFPEPAGFRSRQLLENHGGSGFADWARQSVVQFPTTALAASWFDAMLAASQTCSTLDGHSEEHRDIGGDVQSVSGTMMLQDQSGWSQINWVAVQAGNVVSYIASDATTSSHPSETAKAAAGKATESLARLSGN